MLSLSEIQSFFPQSLQRYPRFMLREYLQYKILDIIYTSHYASFLGFLGGTCLRIVHGNQRFSEDLDFDNRGMKKKQFLEIANSIKKQLELEGYKIEIKLVLRGAWHCYIKFPRLLSGAGLSEYIEEKILIRIDTEPQDYQYEPERVILNKFEVFTTILTVPLPILLSQKLFAILNRSRKQGRDFFDVVFLMSKGVQPDYGFLNAKINIDDAVTLKKAILDICQSLDMINFAKDVEPFLFNSADMQKVVRFADYFRQSFY